MKSSKILFEEREFFISNESLNSTKVQNLFLFEDEDLKSIAKNPDGGYRIINKAGIQPMSENVGAGAGYAVYGGGGGSFGNTRGTGFGQSANNGGPNLMYTYNIVPLNQVLQQPSTPQGNNRYIHNGTEVKAKLLGKDKEVEGKIIDSEKDEEGNLMYYTIIATKTAEKLRIDPTSVEVVTHEERPDIYMRDLVGEGFYPSLDSFLNERISLEDQTSDIKGKKGSHPS